MELHVANLQLRENEVSRASEGLRTIAGMEPPPKPYPADLLPQLCSYVVISSCHLQELVTIILSSIDPSLSTHLLPLNRRLISISDALIAAAHLADIERAQGPIREATIALIGISQSLEKTVKEIVGAIVTLSSRDYRPPGIMTTGQDFDTLLGVFSKAVVRYVSIAKTDIKGEFAEAAVEVVQAVSKIHSYVFQCDIPPEVVEIDLFHVNREILLNSVLSQTKNFAATSKTAASLWPPPKANETSIDTARELATLVKELGLLIKTSGGGFQILEVADQDAAYYDVIQRLRAQGQSILSAKLDSKTKALVLGISKLLDTTPRSTLKEDAMNSLALIQQAVTDIVEEVESLPGFTLEKRRTGSFDQVADENQEEMEILPQIMSDIVKGIRKMIEDVRSGFATSEDYVENAQSIGQHGQQLLSIVEASDAAENFSTKLKNLIRATHVAAGVWSPPEAVAKMSSSAYDLAIALKSLRDLLDAGNTSTISDAVRKVSFSRSGSVRLQFSNSDDSLMKNDTRGDGSRMLTRANSTSQLYDGAKPISGVSRSISSISLSGQLAGDSEGFSTNEILDDYFIPHNQPMGDGMTNDMVCSLSDLVLAVKIFTGPNQTPTSTEAVKVAAQALAKNTKLLISSTIAFSNQVELSGRREMFNNEISDILETKGKESGPAFGKICSDEYPAIPTGVSFLSQSDEVMSDSEFKNLMDDDLSNLLLEVDPNSAVPRIKAGSIDQLVGRLIFYKYPDPDFTEAFLLTYHSFMTPVELLKNILMLYDQPPPLNLSKDQFDLLYKTKVIPTRLRVVNVLKAWIDKHFEDFEADDHLDKVLVEFLTSNKTHHYYQQNTFTQAVNQLKKLYDKKKKKRRQSTRLMLFNQKAPFPILPKSLKKISLVDLDPLEIARQITDIESNLYRAIQPKECLNQSWNKTDLKHQSPNIIAFIHRFNSLTKKVSVEILNDTSKKGRAVVIKHFLQVAEKCMALNNFNALTAIMAAVTCSSIRRLAKTWELVPKKYVLMSEQFEAVISHHSNYDKYRKTLHSLDPPCIPFLGVYLTDLVFIEDGNKDKLNDLINFDKRRKIALVIREIQQYQQTPYCLKAIPEIQALLLSPDNVNEDDLYKLSLELEPRK